MDSSVRMRTGMTCEAALLIAGSALLDKGATLVGHAHAAYCWELSSDAALCFDPGRIGRSSVPRGRAGRGASGRALPSSVSPGRDCETTVYTICCHLASRALDYTFLVNATI